MLNSPSYPVLIGGLGLVIGIEAQRAPKSSVLPKVNSLGLPNSIV